MRTELRELTALSSASRHRCVDEAAGELGAIAHRWFEVMRKCGTKSWSSCMTAVRLHVWEMRLSPSSMYSFRT
jgi:hypothetical protein